MAAGSQGGRQGADLEAIRAVDPDLVEKESLPGSALRQVVEALPDGGRALVAGHSPTDEAAAPGQAIAPPGKAKGSCWSNRT